MLRAKRQEALIQRILGPSARLAAAVKLAEIPGAVRLAAPRVSPLLPPRDAQKGPRDVPAVVIDPDDNDPFAPDED